MGKKGTAKAITTQQLKAKGAKQQRLDKRKAAHKNVGARIFSARTGPKVRPQFVGSFDGLGPEWYSWVAVCAAQMACISGVVGGTARAVQMGVRELTRRQHRPFRSVKASASRTCSTRRRPYRNKTRQSCGGTPSRLNGSG